MQVMCSLYYMSYTPLECLNPQPDYIVKSVVWVLFEAMECVLSLRELHYSVIQQTSSKHKARRTSFPQNCEALNSGNAKIRKCSSVKITSASNLLEGASEHAV
jgi:hypothetical protein